MNKLDEYHYKTPLSQEVFDAVKPVYKELSRKDLLNRCLGGFTQNSNENFNSVVWAIAPKQYFSGKIVLDILVDIAVCTFNDGLSRVMQIMQVLELTAGTNCYNFCIETDAAERSLTSAAIDARTAARGSRKVEEEENFHLEGQLYGAKIAD